MILVMMGDDGIENCGTTTADISCNSYGTGTTSPTTDTGHFDYFDHQIQQGLILSSLVFGSLLSTHWTSSRGEPLQAAPVLR